MTYMNAELELVSFAAEDVLATSNMMDVIETTRCAASECCHLPEEEL